MSQSRENLAPTLIDGLAADLGGPRTAKLLDQLDAAVPWQQLAEPVRAVYTAGSQGGRRPWDPALMLKCLMLAQWFGLSDPQLEEQLRDRLSFRRFVGLSLNDTTPDETSFVVFRRRLREHDLEQVLFDRALSHIESRGLVVREGTIVDATILEAPRGKRKEDGSHTRDPEASYTKKHGRTYHGYKAHVATDTRGLIRKYKFDTAKVHDSQHFDSLTEQETNAVYADSAYMSEDRRAQLKARGVYCGIIRRRVRGQDELPKYQQLINRLLSSTRAVVEHPFAWMTNMGHRRVRYRGRRRNEGHFAFKAMAYNCKRSLSLTPVSG